MKQSDPSKGETLHELKLRQIKYLKDKFGSDPFIDQLEREANEDSPSSEKRIVGTIALKVK